MTVAVGQMAPDFTLKSHDGRTVRLSEYRGKSNVVLAFFPLARLPWALFGLGAVAFGNAIPSLPGAVGTYEGALTAALALVSGDQSTALAAALTMVGCGTGGG